ncbi:MAG: 2-dehydropantoate 2-reductase N-terminal domain-containing protein [Clostridiaceae bacterium]|nr:2-dehydropantoate 2-reductase N-terminal domain-containing protein [Clostridiaceae bacterium]
MTKAVIIGAGKTGRGFIGRLAAEAGCEILFVDQNANLVDHLNTAGAFTISFFGGVREPLQVKNFNACTWDDANLAGADLIFVSVGGQNLEDAGIMLKEKLPHDIVHHIITCENASSPAETLLSMMERDDVIASEAAVFCTTIEDGTLDIISENYPYLQCNADKLRGYVPGIASVKPVDNFGNFLTRKLYTYNASSCVIAYLGAAKGYTVYSDAANDPEILALLDRSYAQINRAMCLEFGYDPEDQAEFARLSRSKFISAAIRDTVERNARDVARKMAPGERIIGIMQLIKKHGGDTSALEMTAAAALAYTADPNWEKLKKEKAPADILREHCGLDSNDALGQRILRIYKEGLRWGL